jgi:UTP--glucose-1-phosphate uridylyltransferase
MTEKKVRKAIIADAGFASRYLPITKTLPKAMLPLGNRPIMQFVISECIEAEIEEIIVVATPEGKPIYEDYFNNSVNRIRKQLAAQGKEDRYVPVQEVLNFPKIVVITQDPSLPYGNGSPFASAKNYVEAEDACLAFYSDDVVFGRPGDAKTLIDAYYRSPDSDAIIMVKETPGEEIAKYAAVSLKDGQYREKQENVLVDIVEKPDPADAPTHLASYGRYLLTPKIFEFLSPQNTGKDGELWTADAIGQLNQAGGKVLVQKSEGEWMTTGDPENYFKAHLKFVVNNEKYGHKVAAWLEELKASDEK